MKFNIKKAVWKMLLGIVSFGSGIFAQNILPQILSPEIQSMTVGALILEILDWLLHKMGANK